MGYIRVKNPLILTIDPKFLGQWWVRFVITYDKFCDKACINL